jgi:hypothetical protein
MLNIYEVLAECRNISEEESERERDKANLLKPPLKKVGNSTHPSNFPLLNKSNQYTQYTRLKFHKWPRPQQLSKRSSVCTCEILNNVNTLSACYESSRERKVEGGKGRLCEFVPQSSHRCSDPCSAAPGELIIFNDAHYGM